MLQESGTCFSDRVKPLSAAVGIRRVAPRDL